VAAVEATVAGDCEGGEPVDTTASPSLPYLRLSGLMPVDTACKVSTYRLRRARLGQEGHPWEGKRLRVERSTRTAWG
jgi:hypothetical protein